MIHAVFHFERIERKRLQNGRFLERADAGDLQDVAHAALDLQFLLDDGHQHVDAHGNPHLRLHGVDRRAVERLDPQVLLDPLEEQLDLPAALVKPSDRQGRQSEVVGQKDEPLVDVGGMVTDPAERDGISLRRLGAAQGDRLIAPQSGGLVHFSIGLAGEVQVALARHEERQALREAIQALEVGVPSIHHVEGTRLDGQQVQGAHVGHRTAGNMHKTRDIAAQVDQRVELDGALVATELRPGKQRKTQVDGGGIEGVDGLLQGYVEVFVDIQPSGLADEDGREVGVDAPVASLVGLGQRVAGHGRPEAGMVELVAHRPQTRLDVAQAL